MRKRGLLRRISMWLCEKTAGNGSSSQYLPAELRGKRYRPHHHKGGTPKRAKGGK